MLDHFAIRADDLRGEFERNGAPAVRLRKLTKRFGRRVALDGLDLELPATELVGVVGPDGAGKTTLLRTLAGLLEIEAEEATVLDVDLRGDVRPLKARLGYVPQAFSLHGDLSVLENLRFTKPVYAGDTIQAKLTCKSKTAKETPPDGIPQGVVAWDVNVTNQENELVATYTILTLVRRLNGENA